LCVLTSLSLATNQLTAAAAVALAPALAAMPQLTSLYLVGNSVKFTEALKRWLRWYEQELNRWNVIQLL
jgi:hypothetical protein